MMSPTPRYDRDIPTQSAETNDFGFTFEFPEGDEALECGIENPESCESCE